MSNFMPLLRAEATFDKREPVLVNPQHISEVRVITYRQERDFPARAYLSLRIQGGEAITILALDSERRPLLAADAAKFKSRELLNFFSQAARSAS